DLSVYHDMNGLWAIGRHGVRATVVVCDNNGGGVFNFLPQVEHQDVFEEIFATPLGLDFAQIARLYGLVYSPVPERSGLEPAIEEASKSAVSRIGSRSLSPTMTSVGAVISLSRVAAGGSSACIGAVLQSASRFLPFMSRNRSRSGWATYPRGR